MHNQLETPRPATSKAWWDLLVLLLGIMVVLVLGLVAVATLSFSPMESASPGAAPAEQAPSVDANYAATTASSQPPALSAPASVISPSTSINANGGDGPEGFFPEVVNQGGTCIYFSGIDIYEQPVGGEGWIVRLDSITSARLNFDSTQQRDDNTFRDLAAGTYRVSLDFPTGWRAFTPTTFDVTLSGDSNDDCAVVRFKLEALAHLEVVKLDAQTKEGLPAPIGIPGWEITLTDEAGTTVIKETTNGEGKAYFTNLAPGKWTVREETKAGWQPAPGYTDNVSILLVSPRVPGTFINVAFVNEQINEAIIVARKTDPGGIPVSDWLMTLTHDDGTYPPQVGRTNSTGFVSFIVPLGNWTVTEDLNDWWRPTEGLAQTVKVDEPGQVYTVTFVNEPMGCVDGYKINHLDQGLSGWTIEARSSSGDRATAVTDANGYFAFRMTLGTWTIEEEVQDGWTPVTPSSFEIDVTTPFACEHVRFKNRTDFACLDVYKRDAYDDVGLPGWLITAQPAYGGVSQSDVTDGTGWVRFNKMVPGTYNIFETAQAGWDSVGPSSFTVNLEASGECSILTFYNQQTNNRSSTSNTGWQPTNEPSGACSAYYTVKSGDTLYRIATHYGVTVSDLRAANRLGSSNLIHPNQRLCIP